MRKASPILFLLLAVLFVGQAGVLLGRSSTASSPGDGEPTPTPTPTLTIDESPSPSASATPSPSPSRTDLDDPSDSPAARVIGGLGAWVDTYDYPSLDPANTVRDLVADGVDTLYLQTGRWRSETAVAPEVANWLPVAKDAGLRVVGWYVPAYDDMSRDVARAAAIATYRAKGARFDAVGIDIEYRDNVSGDAWNEAVITHATRVRAKIGNAILIAITPPPLQMEVAPGTWHGFPWERIAEVADGWVLMAYWDKRDCPSVPDHCPEPYARVNARKFAELVKVKMPLHLAGGVADNITISEVADFVRGADASSAVGISLYDVVTMRGRYWAQLRRFSR